VDTPGGLSYRSSASHGFVDFRRRAAHTNASDSLTVGLNRQPLVWKSVRKRQYLQIAALQLVGRGLVFCANWMTFNPAPSSASVVATIVLMAARFQDFCTADPRLT
jgi:hypothetical protein